MLRISNIKIRKDISNYDVFEIAIKKKHIQKSDIVDWHISKKSIDARNKEDVHYNYSIDLKVKDEKRYPKIEKVKKYIFPTITVKNKFEKRPVIIGAGPAGLFAALTFVQNGAKPIIIEQGQSVEKRKETVDSFLEGNSLNSFSNVQFGEGGAGTFSDGKLTTGINSPFCKKVLQEFVNFGAPEQILYLSKPHIGTDKLIDVIKNMRNYIISLGGTFLFDTKVVDFEIQNEQITAVYYEKLKETGFDTKSEKTISIKKIEKTDIAKKIEKLETNFVVLAIGHSSRDTFEKLYKKGFYMEKKNFSVGVRIEHLQKDINKAQYGTVSKLNLPPAEYKLAYHSPSGRSCYTFCMCPGGVVMASSSDKNTIVTNGMSYFLRDGENANSAILVNVVPEDFEDDSPLAGIYFQKDLEEKAFILGSSNYFAPIQRVEDFLANKKSSAIGAIKPTYLPGVTLSNLNDILPEFVANTLKEGILHFDTKLQGFANPDSILSGLETRSSSPVKIVRNEFLESNISGVYPCGEGAGYAGGIMSAAVDGIKCAIAILEKE